MLRISLFPVSTLLSALSLGLLGCAVAEDDSIQLNVDITARKSIKLASFEKAALDREVYFRSYHMPGLFSEEIDDDLKKIGAIPGRGTGPYYSFDKQHSYHWDLETTIEDTEFNEWYDKVNERYRRIYKTAAERYPGVKHALAIASNYPEGMRKDGDPRILSSDYYKDFSKLMVGFYDSLKEADCSIPIWFTTENEPIWQWGAEEFADYSVILADAMNESHPDVKIAGPCTAWPYPQADWRRWNGWERRFIEVAGDAMDAYDLHMYSKGYWAFTDERLMDDPLYMKQENPSLHSVQRTGIGTVWDYGRMDAYLDLFIAYHMGYWDQDPKPMIISEFGRQGIEPQLGPWENEFKPWLYMTTVTRFWMSFMDRPEIELAVPFILGEACLVYGASRGQAVYNRPNAPEDTDSKVTRFREFYKFFNDLNGLRLRSNIEGSELTDARDIVTRAFIDEDKVYILVHNGLGFPDGGREITINPEIASDSAGREVQMESTEIKRMRWEGPVPEDHTASELEGTLRIDTEYKPLDSLRAIHLQGEETAIIRLSLSDIPSKHSLTQYLDYSTDSLLIPDEEGQCRFVVELPQRSGDLTDARLHIALARDQGFTKNPVVTLNGNVLDGFDVTYSEGITNFHRSVEIPVEIDLLKERNEIVVVFDEDQYGIGHTKAVTAKMITSRKEEDARHKDSSETNRHGGQHGMNRSDGGNTTSASGFKFTPGHQAAVDRQRRIFFQYDPAVDIQRKGGFGSEMEALMGYVFDFADMPGSQLDAICIDVSNEGVAHYRSEILRPIQHPGLMKWREQGLDYFDELIKRGHQRGMEIWWGLRMNEIERGDLMGYEPGRYAELKERNPVKATHPEWLLRSWWWQGHWNYAVKELRDYRLSVIREVVEQYDFDGVHLDFLRHTPHLPPGTQWENREHLTDFLRDVRTLLQKNAAKRGRPWLLAARVPDSVEGCHTDGLDIETWAAQGLVDVLIIGTRTINVDVGSFRKAVTGSHVKLLPSYDCYHGPDGYHGDQSLDLLRGVFGNYLYQGADGVGIFNNPAGSAEHAQRLGLTQVGNYSPEILTTIGSIETMADKARYYAIDRRGGYAHTDGYGSSNSNAPLPITLRYDGTPSTLTLPVWEPVKPGTAARLRLVLFNHVEGDEVDVQLNGTGLTRDLIDAQWKDARIFSPLPQPETVTSGALVRNLDAQRLTRTEFFVPVESLKHGPNSLSISVNRKGPFLPSRPVKVEKVELHLK